MDNFLNTMENKLRAEQWLFVLFVFTLPFAAKFTVLGASLQFSDLMFLAAAIVWAGKFIINPKELRHSWFYVFLWRVCGRRHALHDLLS